MGDKRKIKEIYNCVAIVSNEELYPLQKWYNQLIEKTIDEITIADVLKMIRQKEFTNLAMSKAIYFLQENVFAGELYEGELLEKLSEMDSLFLTSYADDLKKIMKNALLKSKIHDWTYDGEEKEFKDIIDALSQKVVGAVGLAARKFEQTIKEQDSDAYRKEKVTWKEKEVSN